MPWSRSESGCVRPRAPSQHAETLGIVLVLVRPSSSRGRRHRGRRGRFRRRGRHGRRRGDRGATFEHWLTVAARTSGRPKAGSPKPPEFAACVAKRKAEPRPKGKFVAKWTRRAAEQQCSRSTRTCATGRSSCSSPSAGSRARRSELGISVSDADVKKAFDEQRKRSFPKEADYRKWLEESGQSEEDIMLRVRSDLLQTRIRERMTKGDDKVTDEQIADYYKRNKARFGEPARRDVRLVLTETRAEGRCGPDGAPAWRRLARRGEARTRSTPPSRLQGGRLTASPRASRSPARRGPLRGALRELGGPVETPVRLVRLRGAEGQARLAADARAGQGVDRAARRRRAPAEAAQRVRREVPREVAGEDGVPRGLRDAGLQERTEADAGSGHAAALAAPDIRA